MARATIKREDANNINLYLVLTNGIINFEEGTWSVSVPYEGEIFYGDMAELLEFVQENLTYMEESYQEQGEQAEWDYYREEAKSMKFKLGA